MEWFFYLRMTESTSKLTIKKLLSPESVLSAKQLSEQPSLIKIFIGQKFQHLLKIMLISTGQIFPDKVFFFKDFEFSPSFLLTKNRLQTILAPLELVNVHTIQVCNPGPDSSYIWSGERDWENWIYCSKCIIVIVSKRTIRVFMNMSVLLSMRYKYQFI